MKLAIIGSYGHVGVLLGGIADCPDVELVAAARWGPDDPLGYVGRHAAAPEGLPVYDDAETMLDAARPDVVGVCCPLFLNARASLAAVQRGCHVVSEKPLATDLADLDTLRRATEDAGVEVAALMTARTEPPLRAVRQLVADGRIGRPVLACAQKSYPFATRDDFYRSRDTYGGSIPWQAIHALDFVAWGTGQDFTRAAAMASNATRPDYPGMEDNGGILLELTGGGHAVVWFDYLRPWPGDGSRRWGDDRLRIVGTEGQVEVVDEGTAVRLMTNEGQEQVELGEPASFLGRFVAGLRGEAPPLVTTAESFRITEVALRCRDAADTGRPVDLA